MFCLTKRTTYDRLRKFFSRTERRRSVLLSVFVEELRQYRFRRRVRRAVSEVFPDRSRLLVGASDIFRDTVAEIVAAGTANIFINQDSLPFGDERAKSSWDKNHFSSVAGRTERRPPFLRLTPVFLGDTPVSSHFSSKQAIAPVRRAG